MITYSAPVQVSGRCPRGGDRACRFCLSNEITSHSRPVHQKTQRDQCWTAGLQWVAVLVEAASVSKSPMKKHVLFLVKFTCGVFTFQLDPAGQESCIASERFQQLQQTSVFYLDGIIYNISAHNQTAVSEILIWSQYEAFGNGMCFIIHESLKIKLQP